MDETINSISAIDYFASMDIGNQILKVLHDIPIEKARNGGISHNEIEKNLSEYKIQLQAKDLLPKKRAKSERPYIGEFEEKLRKLLAAGQIESQVQEGDTAVRYRLTNETLFYIHNLCSATLPFKATIEKEPSSPQFKLAAAPGQIILNEIILVPGSLLLAGDHSVLLGQPAVVLPIPLFLCVHAIVSTSTKTVVEPPYEVVPNPNSLFGKLSCFPGTPIHNSRIGDKKLSRVVKRFEDKLRQANSLTKTGYHVTLCIHSQIPSGCGLGSSGALSVALSRLLDQIMNLPDKEDPLKTIGKKDLNQQLRDKNSRLSNIFLDAVEFEREIHRHTSGVGPFASLLGGDCFTPILYDLGCRPEDEWSFVMDEVLDQRNEQRDYKLDLTYKRGAEKAQRYLGKDLALAAVYTTQPRQPLETTLNDVAYLNGLKKEECRRDFVNITNKMWQNLSEDPAQRDDPEDVVTCINLFGGYEEGYLKMLRADSESIPRDLMYRMRGAGLGAKYTGAGFGGDIVVIGPKETVRMMLIPNYFPVHFSSVNLSLDSPPIDREAHCRIIQTREFTDDLVPKFMDRARRSWVSY